MILFLDTSALVKLSVDELDSGTARRWVEQADQVACQWLAYVEARSAFAAKRRLGEFSEQDLARCRQDLESSWPRYHRVAVTQPILRRASTLSEELAVRAYDGVHLASAEYLQAALGSPVTFGSFDLRQVGAAVRLGLLLPPAEDTPSG